MRDRTDSEETHGTIGPEAVLEAMVAQAEGGDWEGFSNSLDGQSSDLLDLYRRRKDLLYATTVAEDPAEALFRQFQEFRPRVVGVQVQGDQADVDVVYANGVSARLRFQREGARWKFGLSHHMGPSVRIMGDTCLIKRAYLEGSAR